MSLLTQRPLALLSLCALVSCWLPIYLQAPGKEPTEDLALSIGLTVLVAVCPIFNLIKGLTRTPIAHYWRASLFLSVPSAAAVFIVLWDTAYPGSNWLGGWMAAQFLILPVIWAIGHSYWEAPVANV